ncbi:MAG: sugar ABC transporter substrate-binding protein [Verrucomicrobia bacterium]|nr:sugar ABC transporter substrate-binding protein [Verrucomicrobiota bacterium]
MKIRFPKVIFIATSTAAIMLAAGFLRSARAEDNQFDWKQASGVKLVVMLNKHPYADAIIKKLPEFKELTGIDVEYTETPEENYFDKLTTALASKNGNPDVFMTGTYQLWDYATSGYMEPLDQYLNDPAMTNPGYDIKDFFQGVLNGGKWNLKPGSPVGTGQQWALALGFETNILAYNKKYFDEKGIQVPKTFDELYDLAKKLKGWNGPGSYGVAVRGTRNWATIHPGYMTTFSGAGAKDFEIKDGKLVSALDQPLPVEVTKKWAQLVKDGGPPAWANYTWYQCGADFGAGKAAMLYDADILGYFQNVPGASSQAGNIAYAPGPVWKEGDPVGANEWIWQIAINSSSKNKKAAWVFTQYFTGKEHGTWAAIDASVVDPPRKSIWENKDFQAVMAKMPGYLDTFNAIIGNTSIKFTPQPYFFESTTEWAATLQKIVLSGTDPKSAMTDLAKRITRNTSKLEISEPTKKTTSR